MKIRFILILATCLPLTEAFAESYQWTNPSSGNWNNPDNWTPNQVPGSGDTASIPGNGLAIVIDSTVSISGLNLGGGSSLSVASGGVLNIGGKVDLFGPLINAGTVNWQDGRIDLRRTHRCPKVLMIRSLRAADPGRRVTVASLLFARSLKLIFQLKTPQIG